MPQRPHAPLNGVARHNVWLLALLWLLVGGTLPLNGADAAPGAAITALAVQGDTLWVGLVDGLARQEAGRLRRVELPLADGHVLALHAEGAALWVGTARAIGRWEGGRWQQWQRGDAALASPWATSFATHEGALHVGSYGAGVQRWQGSAWEPLGVGGPTQVTALASAGATLWAGSPSALWAWQGAAWAEVPLPVERGHITALLAAADGLWVGSDVGLFHQPPGSRRLEAQPVVQPVSALAATAQGVVVATRDGTLRRSDGSPLRAALGYVSALAEQGGTLAVGTMGGGLLALDAPDAPDRATRLPVVLIHGLDDSDLVGRSNLRFLAEWLRADGFPVTMADTGPDQPLLANVASLRHAVAEARAQAPGGQVLLIGHSFGGLVGRAYLASGARDVAGLLTLGSPHAGLRLLYDELVQGLAGDRAAATRELLPEHAALIEPFQADATVPQLHIGGTRLPEGALLAGLPANDALVGAASAVAAPGATRLAPLLHGWTLQSVAAGIPALTWPDDLYQRTLLPWLEAASAGAAWADRAEAPPLPEPGFVRRPLLDRALAPGELLTVPVPLGEGAATWLLRGAGLQMTLVAPDGSRYGADRLLLSDSIAHLPFRADEALALDLWGTQQRPGLWQAIVENPTAQPVAAALALVEPGAAPLRLSVAQPWVEPGAPLTVQVTGQPGQALSANLAGLTSPLVERAAGQFEGELVAPRQPGYHALRVGNEGVERWAVVGVASDAWAVQEATLRRAPDGWRLRLTVVGEGPVAVGLRGAGGSRLAGPFRFAWYGPHTLELRLPGNDPQALSWQLFDARGALLPATPLLPLDPDP